LELQLYLDILKRRALVIVIVVAMTLVVMATAGLILPPVYQAQSTMRVILDVGISDLILREDYNTRLLNTYAKVLESEPILREAIERSSPQTAIDSVTELSEDISIEVIPDTELIAISVKNSDPVFARDLANNLSLLLMEYAQDLYVGSSKSTRQIVEDQLATLGDELEADRQQLASLMAAGEDTAKTEALTQEIRFKEDAYDRLLERYETARLNESLRGNSIAIIAPARLPTEPANKLGLRELAIGLAIGLLGGMGLALVLENLDTRIHSPKQMERLFGLPALGSVPRGFLTVEDLEREDASESSRPIEEAYRLLGINLLVWREQILKDEGVPMQTVLITSAGAHEGKSMVAANLARTFADQGQTVFLVESDLRHPTLTERMGADNEAGLGNLLVDRLPLDDTILGRLICPTEQPSLFVICSGPKVPNPVGLLASPPMDKLIDYLGAQGQLTLLDAPPVLGMADVSVLAPRVDGIILVIRQAFSDQEAVSRALKQLQAMRTRLLGVVFVQKSNKDWGY
jgi:capsular exopolysaccharide synthesis family protein